MEWVETTAKSVIEAKDSALDRLGVDEQDAEFEILEEPRPGLFGRMRGEARVRARVRPVQARAKAERRDKRRPGRSGAGRGRNGDKSVQTESSAESAGDEDKSESQASKPERKATTGGRGRRPAKTNQQAEPSSKSARAADSADKTNAEEPTVSVDATVDEQAVMVHEFVEGLVTAFGYEAEVQSTKINDETVEVRVDGDDLGLLVGPRGATLQAIHDLSRTVVQRRATGNHEGRVRLDVAGYRGRRREALERFTQNVASEVVESGVAQVLEPMSPVDRKVVHDTANAIEGVKTASEGDEPRRRVVILPATD